MNEQVDVEQNVRSQYVCVACRRVGDIAAFSDECRPGWTHDRLLPIETTAEAALRNDHYDRQLQRLAEVGASLCCYMPGSGNPTAWPTARCDCKFLPADLLALVAVGAEIRDVSGEQTGCCEVRQAWRVLAMLRERSHTS
jgi:hypothetical protein